MDDDGPVLHYRVRASLVADADELEEILPEVADALRASQRVEGADAVEVPLSRAAAAEYAEWLDRTGREPAAAALRVQLP